MWRTPYTISLGFTEETKSGPERRGDAYRNSCFFQQVLLPEDRQGVSVYDADSDSWFCRSSVHNAGKIDGSHTLRTQSGTSFMSSRSVVQTEPVLPTSSVITSGHVIISELLANQQTPPCRFLFPWAWVSILWVLSLGTSARSKSLKILRQADTRGLHSSSSGLWSMSSVSVGHNT